MPTATLPITGDPAADDLLVTDPLALVIGMLLDQQVPMGWAFRGPFVLRERLAARGLEWDAATLAVLYSDFKKSGKGEVIYTRKKWVRKAKGRAAGTVTVTQERTIFLQLDKGRLDRLKSTAE